MNRIKPLFILIAIAAITASITQAAVPNSDEDSQQEEEGASGDYDEENERVWLSPQYENFDHGETNEEVTICAADTDCPEYPYYLCQRKVCMHKGIFPIYRTEFFGVLILTFLIALANVGGVGGGGLIIPIIMAMFSFSTKEAIAISGFTIFTGSVARFFYAYNQRHPDKDATMIDYGIVIVMMPLVLMGSFLGVLVNIMLPPILLSSFLTVILLMLTSQSLFKGIQIYNKETLAMKQRSSQEQELAVTKKTQAKYLEFKDEVIEEEQEERQTKVDTAADYEGSVRSETTAGEAPAVSVEDQEAIKLLLEKEKSHIKQWRKHCLAIIIICISLIVNFVRGSRKTPSIIGITKCGVADWSIFTAFIVIAFGLSYIGVILNKKEQALKERCGVRSQSDLCYNGRPLALLLIFAFLGGWVSGAFGLGGGSVFNPLMIELGVPPTVSTSTGMYMIMFSTLASSVIYITYGALNLDYALWLGFWSVIGIMGGIGLVNGLIKKYQRQSILVFILVLVLGISAIMVPIFNGLEVWKQLEQGKDVWRFTSICS